MPNVRDVMTKDVLTVDTDTPIRDFVALIQDRGFSALPVLDGKGHALGIVSHSDVLRGLVAFLGAQPLGGGAARRRMAAVIDDLDEATPAKTADYLAQSVQTIMEHELVRTTPDTSLQAACKAMRDARVRRLVVEDGDELVGILSATDVVAHVAARG